MKKYIALSLLLIIGLWLAQPMSGLAQSGRRRPRKRAPRPTRPEAPTNETPAGKPEAPVPAGGKIEKQKFDPRTATTWVRLKNGLTIILREKYSKPLVAISVYVKAGREDEPEGAEGVAELVGRLLFHGTASRPETQAARQMRRLGAVIGARASTGNTTYLAVVPAEKAAQAVEIQADILQHPLFAPESVRRQAELLAQEYEAQRSDLPTRAFHSMLQLAFPAQPLGRTPTPDGIRALTRDQVLEFYRQHYRPDNTIVSVVGAANAFIIKEALRRAYGAWTAQPATGQQPAGSHQPARESDHESRITNHARRPTPDEPGSQLRYGQQVMEIDPALVTIGYRLTGVRSSDRPALDVLATVLGRGRVSRLEQELRGARPVVWDFSLDRIEMEKGALWSFQLWVAPERLSQAEIAFFESVQRLRRQVVSPGELQRAQSLLERWFYHRRARLGQEAEDVARAEAAAGDYRGADGYVQRIRAVTAEQLQRVAASYLTLSHVTVYEVAPRRAAAEGVTGESFAGWIAAKVPGLDHPVTARDVRQAPPVTLVQQGQRARPGGEAGGVIFSLQPEPVRNYSVLRGSRAYVREDHSRPTVSVGLFFEGGRLFEDASNNGITELMLRAMLRGARSKWDVKTGQELERGEEVTLSARIIALKLEQLGAEVQVINQPDFFGFILNVLSRNQEPALKLLIDIIERPTLDKDDLARVRRRLLYAVRQQRLRPIDAAWQALAAQSPYSLPPLGPPRVLEALTPERVRAWHDRTIGHQFPLTVIVGDTDGSALISDIVARAFHRREVQQSFRVRVPQPLTQPREQVVSGQHRSALAVGFLIPSGKSPEDEALEAIAQALTGPGGRFTDRLCDQLGLAYKVQVTYDRRFLAGGFFTTLALLPKNEVPARQALEREFNRLASEPMSDDEVTLGVNAAIAAQIVKLQQHPARVLAYAQRVFFNRQPAEVERYGSELRALSKDQIRAAARRYLKWSQRGEGILRQR